MSHPRTWFRRAIGVALPLAALVVAACSDTVTTGPNAPRVNIVPVPPQIVKVCKEGPAGLYNFELESVEGLGEFLVGTPVTLANGISKQVSFQVAAGSCVDAYKHNINVLETVKVREVAPMPAGVELDFATYQQQAFNGFPAGPVITVTGSNEVSFAPFQKPWTVTFYNKKNEQVGLQGCTPGFWKNSPGSWPATGYALTDDFDTVFGVDLFFPNVTLGQAIALNGGGVNALARHAVAGLLAASHPDVNYTITSAEIIAAVQAAAANPASLESIKNTLDRYNNQGCPLANDDSVKN